VQDPSGALRGAYGIGRDGAALVRPDGFIAFRARTARAAPEDVLADALARILVSPPLRAAGCGVNAAPSMHR
jgi:putative polyketide hydroxylase